MKKYYRAFSLFALVIAFAIPRGDAYAIPTFEDACGNPLLQSNLTVGSSGQDVSDLQNFLADQGLLDEGSVSGYYGRLTRGAVREFQSQNGIVSSGTAATTGYGAVGSRTRIAINYAVCGGEETGGGSTTPIAGGTTQAVYPVTITADKTSVKPGDEVTLTYTRNLHIPNTTRTCKLTDTTGVTYETMDSRNPANGTRAVYPYQTTTYKFNCSYSIAGFTIRSVDDFVNVRVGDDVATLPGNIESSSNKVSITADKTAVAPGQPVTLTWSAPVGMNNAVCYGSGAQGSDGPMWNDAMRGLTSGAVTVSPTVNTTYTMNCVNGTTGVLSGSVIINVSGNPSQSSINLKANASEGPITITPGSSLILSWSISPTNLDCKGSASPTALFAFGGPGGVITTGNGSQTMNGVTQNTVYTITCVSPTGQTTIESVTVNIGGGSTTDYSISLKAGGNTGSTLVSAGSSVLIEWDLVPPNTNFSSCTGSGAFDNDGLLWNGGKTRVGKFTATPRRDTIYTLTCVAGGVTKTASVAVSVGTGSGTQPRVMLTASATNVSIGGSMSLAWSSQNVTSCTASEGPSNSWAGSWVGSKPTSGFQQSIGGLTNPSNIYILTCTGPNGTASDRIEVRVSAGGISPSITSFTAVGGAVFGNFYSFQRPNQDWTFSWTATGAIYCALSSPSQGVNFTGQLPISGSRVLSIFADETYTLSCPAAVGAVVPTATAQYSVVRNLNAMGPIVNFSSSATSVGVNQDFTLTWSSPGATRCSGGGDGSFSLYGNSTSGTRIMRFFSPGTFTMTLRCDSTNGGSTTQTVTMIITNSQVPLPVASNPSGLSVDIEANNSDGPVNITAGQSVTLKWGAGPNATIFRMVCVASGSWSGNKNPVSSVTLTPIQSGTYTISCQDLGTGPAAVDSVTVNVVPLNPAFTVVAPTLGQTGVTGNVQLSAVFNANSSSVISGQSTTLTWSALYSNICEITADGAMLNAGGSAFGSMSTGALTRNTTFGLSCYRWVSAPAPIYGTKAFAPTQSVTVSVTTPTQGTPISTAPVFTGSGVTVDLRANNMKGSVTTTAASAAVTLSHQLLSNNPQELIGWTCNATGVPGINSISAGGGQLFVRPSSTSSYTVTCTSYLTGQVVNDSVTVTVI